MPARNRHHDTVVAGLIADGWTITADPLTVSIGSRQLFVDLAAERAVTVAAERDGRRIAVEVQSFVSRSNMDDLHRAVGQFVVYRTVLKDTHADHVLYLAVDEGTFGGVSSEPLGEMVIAELPLRLVVFRTSDGGIVRWIN